MDPHGLARSLSSGLVKELSMQRRLYLLLIVFCLLTSFGCKASKSELLEKKAMKQLFADDWKVRESALFTLGEIESKDYKPSAEIQKRVVSLLDEEIQAYVRDKQIPPNGHDDYIKIISRYLASNKVNEGFSTLFRLIAQTGYHVTPALLASYGNKHLNFLVDKATQGTDKERETALSVLTILLNTSVECDDFDTSGIPSLDHLERNMVKPVFVKAAKDPNYNIRYIALSGLEEFIADDDVKAMIKEIARSDYEKFIRDDAKEILNRHR